MELEKLINDTLSCLKLKSEPIEKFEGIQIAIDSHLLILEKIPTQDALSVSIQFCQYQDTTQLQKLFELLLNLHAFGLLTKGAFFAADSDNDLIIFHKIIELENLEAQKLAMLIEEFYHTYISLEQAWKNGEFDYLVKTVSTGNELPDNSLGIRI